MVNHVVSHVYYTLCLQMQSEYRVVLTKIYVLLVNETPVEEVVDELGRKLNVQDNVYIQREKVWEPAIVV